MGRTQAYNSSCQAAILLLTLTLILLTLVLVHNFTDNLPFLRLLLLGANAGKSSETLRYYSESRCRRSEQKCDLFSGNWIPYRGGGPYYTNRSHCVIDGGQNCIKFGRRDTNFMKWRWKPDECELPLFDPVQFLELVRGKSMAFVGDSLSRNQFQSLGCLLSSVVHYENDSSMEEDESRFVQWFYKDYKFTLTHVHSEYLVKAHGVDPAPKKPIDLYLNDVDETWASVIRDFDYVIISSGHWYSKPLMYYEKGELVGCYQCNQTNVTDLTGYYGYRVAFETAFRALIDHRRSFKGKLLLRTISPSHFEFKDEGGRGFCPRQQPYEKQEMSFDWYIGTYYMIQMEEFRKARKEARTKGLGFRLLDVTEAMRLRPDGHPNIYGLRPRQKIRSTDCLHWCLPGPIDTWNELLLQMLKDEKNSDS